MDFVAQSRKEENVNGWRARVGTFLKERGVKVLDPWHKPEIRALHAMSDIANYEVGYRRPPKHTQFQKGQSGNPRCKPKTKNQTFAGLIDGALERRIWISEGDLRKRVTVLEAITTQLADAAAKGDGEAVDLLMLLDRRGKKHGRGQTIIVEIIPDDGKVVRRHRDEDDGDH